MPYNQALNIYPYIQHTASSESTQFDDKTRLIFERIMNGGKETGEIVNFLKDEDYITPVNHSIPSYLLNAKGRKAKELGGHNQYKEWETRESKKKNFEEFPKRQWHLYDIGKILFGILLGMIINNYLCNKTRSNNDPSNNLKKDSIQKIAPSQSSSKTSDSINNP